MARVEYGRHKRVATTADDSTSDIRPQRDWNGDSHDQVGLLGFDGVTTNLASDAFVPAGTVHVISAESSTADNLATITNTNSQENDWLVLFSTTGHTITCQHGTGNIVMLSAAHTPLSNTVATIFFRRGTNWYEFGGGTVSDGDITNAKLADMAANTIKVRDANSSGDPSDKAIADTQLLIGDGTGFTAAAMSGDVTMTNAGVVTVGTDAIDLPMLSATGTAGATTFLRGDNSWAAPVGPHTTQDWTAQGSAPSNPSAGTAISYVKTIDSDNEGFFIKMKKNGSIVEVQVG